MSPPKHTYSPRHDCGTAYLGPQQIHVYTPDHRRNLSSERARLSTCQATNARLIGVDLGKRMNSCASVAFRATPYPEMPDSRTTSLDKTACSQCRRRKTKCSAQRPVRSYCARRGLHCSWDVLEGFSKTDDLKAKVQQAEMHLHRLFTLVDALRSASDELSLLHLAKLRLGVPVEEIVLSILSAPVESRTILSSHPTAMS